MRTVLSEFYKITWVSVQRVFRVASVVALVIAVGVLFFMLVDYFIFSALGMLLGSRG